MRQYQRLGSWIKNGNTGESMVLMLCLDCGSAVGKTEIHDNWHRRVEEDDWPGRVTPTKWCWCDHRDKSHERGTGR